MRGKRKIIMNILLILFIVLFFGSAVVQRKYMLGMYEEGINRINNEDYWEAQEILEDLGDYKDSLRLIEAVQTLGRQKEIYDRAMGLFNDGDYRDAIVLFEQTGNYGKSKEYVGKANDILGIN